MNPSEQIPAAVRVSPDGPDVTWIGPNPFTRGLCLGFDNGSVIFSDSANGYTTAPQEISPTREAINGVAAVGTASLAVSTRAEITFLQLTDHSRAFFHGGAHGVMATKSGYFIALLGAKGLLMMRPESGPQQIMNVTMGTEGHLYFYRMTALYDATGKETLVFANRRNGVGVSEFKGIEATRSIHAAKFEGLDVVDVCGIAPGSLSAIAISPKGEILWFKDTSKRDDPIAMKLGGIEGQVYRVLATSQHLFVLSSSALYVWADLVNKVLFDNTAIPKSHPLVIPLEAIDMCIYEDRYVYLVMAVNAITSLEIHDLVRKPFGQVVTNGLYKTSIELARKTVMEDFEPNWQRNDINQIAMATTS